MDELDQLEEALELDFFAWGWEKARQDERKGGFADTMAGREIIAQYIDPLVEVINLEQKELEDGENRAWGTALLALDPPRLALLTLRATLNCLVHLNEARSAITVMRVSRQIGNWCWLEITHDRQKRKEQALLERLIKRNKNPYVARRRAEEALARFLTTDWEKTNLDLHLGGYLLHAAILTTGLFRRRAPKTPGRQLTLELTAKGRRDLDRLLDLQNELIAPRWPPMVKRPTPWKGVHDGGYIHPTGLTLVIDLVHSRNRPAIEAADLMIPCEAVNAIQETAWRLDGDLWALFAKAWDAKSPAETLPHFEFRKLPPRLPEDAPEKDLAKRKYERAEGYRANREAAAHRVEVEMKRLVVSKLGEHAIYFPTHLDWRGRAYMIPQFLHPQADEVARGVLAFDRAKPLGERGAWWLAVHLANCYGNDKLPFQHRVAWVNENDAAILDSAAKPFEGAQFWVKADKPWRFLAAAREWAAYRRDGPGYASRLPIAMDGTCNGLQHLSAIGRDPVGGFWTNLVPGDRPQDIYSEVARKLHELLQKLAHRDALAVQWLPLVDRKLAKPPTMTTPYGIGLKGIRRQLRQRLRETGNERLFESVDEATKYLAELVREAIAEVVVQGSKISRWLQHLAWRLAKRSNVGIAWTSPVGLPMEQRSLKMTLAERVTTLAGVLGKKLPIEPHVVEPKEQRKGIVPNLTHSLDAAHMMRTVRALHAKGLRDFAMVHDSYAVHACDVDTMNAVLRDEFVKLHEEWTLAAWFEGVVAANPAAQLKPPPKTDSLNLADVREAEYFFA